MNDVGCTSVTPALTTTPIPAGAFTPIRVNAGGGAYTDHAGTVWSTDSGFTGGNTFATTGAIAGTVDQALYQDERSGANGGCPVSARRTRT